MAVSLDRPGESALEEGLLQHVENTQEDDEETYKLKLIRGSGSSHDDDTPNDDAKEM
jgi:hypothetical protein